MGWRSHTNAVISAVPSSARYQKTCTVCGLNRSGRETRPWHLGGRAWTRRELPCCPHALSGATTTKGGVSFKIKAEYSQNYRAVAARPLA